MLDGVDAARAGFDGERRLLKCVAGEKGEQSSVPGQDGRVFIFGSLERWPAACGRSRGAAFAPSPSAEWNLNGDLEFAPKRVVRFKMERRRRSEPKGPQGVAAHGSVEPASPIKEERSIDSATVLISFCQ